jgi:succinyl-CoA synthetase alpha subunit
LPAGIRFSHASVILQRGRDSAESKEKALREAGAHVVNNPKELALTAAKILKK